PQKAYKRPAKPDRKALSGEVLDYLTRVRKLSLATLKAFKVAASRDDTEIIFPYHRDGDLLNVKYLGLHRRPDGKKVIRQEADAEPCLFGWDLIPDDAKSLIIVEGEIDAMSLYEYRVPALSVHSGCSNHAWIDSDFDRLERFQEIFIWFDNDAPGKKGALEVAARLGIERCRIVEFRLKDANEALQEGLTDEDIGQAILDARRIERTDLRTPMSYVDDVVAMFSGPDQAHTGALLPWPSMEERVRLRPAELSVWTGINGHGKSDMLGHVMVDLIKQGERVCVFSGETMPRKLLRRLTQQACASAVPSEGYIRAAHSWMDGALWIFDRTGNAEQSTLLEAFRYAAKRYRVTHFFVDSLLKCGLAEDDYTGQKRFIEQLCDFKNEFTVHVHLVAHARKGQDESRAPGKMDIRGGGALTDLPDNVFSVWRNKAKEAKGEPKGEGDRDAEFQCLKQRATGDEPLLRLWFDGACLQFKQSPHWHPKPYFQYSSIEGVTNHAA
ncbi:MAG TPA: bifunctional DNA primase/helicase, partial [Steroidobacteraceae bacterium]|nr:bifunctional DNA primase/helicase [Steroidobacteraceae bacterium]